LRCNTDDFERVTVDRECLADDRGVAAEHALPQLVAEHGDGRFADLRFVVGCQEAP
jgi:hypothetical protein